VIRALFGGLALACCCLPAHAGGPAFEQSRISSMRFEWHSEGPPALCGTTCRTWISAVGPVTERTPSDFEAFTTGQDARGARLVLDSEGGSVVDTIALGHAIRALDITTSVGATVTSSAGDWSTATISPAASCESMCAFILLAGTHRYVPTEARVLVHEIWLAKKRDRPESASYTAEELVLVQHDIGSLARYTIEMGGKIELLETALRVPPWEPLYRLSSDEIARMGLNTVDRLFDDGLPAVATTAGLGLTLAKSPPISIERN
jgi:hypothetical protein